MHPSSILTSRRFVLYWNFQAGIFLLSEEFRLFDDGVFSQPTTKNLSTHISCGNRTQYFDRLCFALSQLATFSFPLHSRSPHQTFTDSFQEDMTDHYFPGYLGLARLNFWALPHSQPGSAMEFLNAGSTAEGSSTKRSSLSPVKPVGSGFSSPSRVSAPLVQGPVFSTDTDTDPNTSETRFVCFDLIPEQWTQESAEGCVLNRALEYVSSSLSACRILSDFLTDWSDRIDRQCCGFSQ